MGRRISPGDEGVAATLIRSGELAAVMAWRQSVAVPTPPTISLLSFIRPIMSILIIATVLLSGTIG
jgi:hypothetical protein